jgi:hypothetical protein
VQRKTHIKSTHAQVNLKNGFLRPTKPCEREWRGWARLRPPSEFGFRDEPATRRPSQKTFMDNLIVSTAFLYSGNPKKAICFAQLP